MSLTTAQMISLTVSGLKSRITSVRVNPPITAALDDTTIEEATSLIGSISAKSARNSAVLAYSLSGPDADLFEVTDSGVISFIDPPDYDTPQDADADNVFDLTYTVSDGAGSTVSVDIEVTVEAATFITMDSAPSVVEGDTAVVTMTANRAVTWSITGGADAALFSINSSTGELVFDEAPDFGTPADDDEDNVYVVTVQAVAASGATDTQTLSIIVIEAPSATEGFDPSIEAAADISGTEPKPHGFPGNEVYAGVNGYARLAGGGLQATATSHRRFFIDEGYTDDGETTVTVNGIGDSIDFTVMFGGNGASAYPYNSAAGTGYGLRIFRASTAVAWAVNLIKILGDGNNTSLQYQAAALPAGTENVVIKVRGDATHVYGSVTPSGGSEIAQSAADASYRGDFVGCQTRTDSGTAPIITIAYDDAAGVPPLDLADRVIDWTEPMNRAVGATYNSCWPLSKIGSYNTAESWGVAHLAPPATKPSSNNDGKIWNNEVECGYTDGAPRESGHKMVRMWTNADAAWIAAQMQRAELHMHRTCYQIGNREGNTIWISWSEKWSHLDKVRPGTVLQLMAQPFDYEVIEQIGSSAWANRTPTQEAELRGTGPCVHFTVYPVGGELYYQLRRRTGKVTGWSETVVWQSPQPIQVGKWYDIMLAVKQEQDATGRIRLWFSPCTGTTRDTPFVLATPTVQAANVQTVYQMPVIDGIQVEAGANEIRWGIYRWSTYPPESNNWPSGQPHMGMLKSCLRIDTDATEDAGFAKVYFE